MIERKVPKLRFPEFSGDWATTALGGIAKFIGGGTPSTQRADFWSGEIPWISSSDLIEDNISYINTTRFITKDAVNNSATKIVPRNSVLIVSRVGVGKIAVNNIEICTSQDFQSAVLYNNNSYFVAYLLQMKTKKLIELNQGTSIKGFVKDDLSSLMITMPQLQEQTKIADFLTNIDDKIEQLTKKKELLEQYKKGVMRDIFSQKIRFKDDNGNDYPDWNYLGGDLLFDSISDKNHNSDLPVLAITQEHGAIPRDLIDYNISVTDKSVSSYKVVNVGDFIISLRSFQGGIEYSNYKGICSPAYIILRNKIEVDKYFYKLYFKTNFYISMLNKNIEGIRDGKMVSYSQFSDIELPYPSLDEQNKIANFLTSIDNKITQVNTQLEQTKLFKKSLLQQIFI